MVGLEAIAAMSGIWGFITKFGGVMIIVVSIIWSISQSLAYRDDNLRIQNQLNRKAEAWHQRDQAERGLNQNSEGERLIHNY